MKISRCTGPVGWPKDTDTEMGPVVVEGFGYGMGSVTGTEMIAVAVGLWVTVGVGVNTTIVTLARADVNGPPPSKLSVELLVKVPVAVLPMVPFKTIL